jgi:hypothetical protein
MAVAVIHCKRCIAAVIEDELVLLAFAVFCTLWRRSCPPAPEHPRPNAGSPRLSAVSATSAEKGSGKGWLGSLLVAPLMIATLILGSLLQQGDFDAETRDR